MASRPADPAEDASRAKIKQTVRGRETTDGTVDIGILGLEVRGKLATVTLAFTPHYPSVSPGESISLYDMNGENGFSVGLVDSVNLRRYSVVGGVSAESLGTEPGVVNTEAINNSSVTARWTFAAPSPNVTKIDVEVGDWPVFRDVPIER